MVSSSQQGENVIDVVAFGQMLEAIKNRLGLTQRQIANHVQMDEATVSRIIKGTRKSLRYKKFFERLSTLPGITDADIRALLSSDNAPAYLIENADDVQAPYATLSPGSGIRIAIYADASLYPAELLQLIRDLVDDDVKTVLRRDQERQQRLDKLYNQADQDPTL